ncbi:predicted protein [Postia placenta Mad-698-R]|uniref:C2H2-type domain-containing protein n=1 Tax=Postia placenta MAD-698-R-SB12 TaxID=670580 RepID=A0A1X6N026_9APHY|nr:hypothetical protein POSPLADRAFT_1143152 [Postia placenta MAD-698-R-SB12]EED82697.1 predicted protein [Postia placenta Mad-698-R]OSX61964.1 hypothetical protein POSPLADRAFT_1143152 [Postia placenta MAD-698-R-SB12]
MSALEQKILGDIVDSLLDSCSELDSTVSAASMLTHDAVYVLPRTCDPTFPDGAARLGYRFTVKATSTAVRRILNMPGYLRVPVLDTFADLKMARFHSAALVRQEQVLVMWSEREHDIIDDFRDVEHQLRHFARTCTCGDVSTSPSHGIKGAASTPTGLQSPELGSSFMSFDVESSKQTEYKGLLGAPDATSFLLEDYMQPSTLPATICPIQTLLDPGLPFWDGTTWRRYTDPSSATTSTLGLTLDWTGTPALTNASTASTARSLPEVDSDGVAEVLSSDAEVGEPAPLEPHQSTSPKSITSVTSVTTTPPLANSPIEVLKGKRSRPQVPGSSPTTRELCSLMPAAPTPASRSRPFAGPSRLRNPSPASTVAEGSDTEAASVSTSRARPSRVPPVFPAHLLLADKKQECRLHEDGGLFDEDIDGSKGDDDDGDDGADEGCVSGAKRSRTKRARSTSPSATRSRGPTSRDTKARKTAHPQGPGTSRSHRHARLSDDDHAADSLDDDGSTYGGESSRSPRKSNPRAQPPREQKRKASDDEYLDDALPAKKSKRGHKKTRSTKATKKYACTRPGCTRTYTRRGDMKRHRDGCGKKPKPAYFCDTCGKGFLRKDAMMRHSRSENGCNKYRRRLKKQASKRKRAGLRDDDEVGTSSVASGSRGGSSRQVVDWDEIEDDDSETDSETDSDTDTEDED